MKRFLLTIALLASLCSTQAQNEKFIAAMKSNVTLLDSAKLPQDFTESAAAFERIADAEKTQWLPYYYAAYATIVTGFMDEKANKDALADKADGLISKALSLQPKSSELYLLKAMAATLHMMVDPMNRWQKYGTDSREAMMTARQLDPNNPRTYYFEGQTLMGTPEQFGGGKAKAKPVFEKAMDLYGTFKPASEIDPNWGMQMTKQLLEACKAG